MTGNRSVRINFSIQYNNGSKKYESWYYTNKNIYPTELNRSVQVLPYDSQTIEALAVMLCRCMQATTPGCWVSGTARYVYDAAIFIVQRSWSSTLDSHTTEPIASLVYKLSKAFNKNTCFVEGLSLVYIENVCVKASQIYQDRLRLVLL